MSFYVETSALVKLAVVESESEALRRALGVGAGHAVSVIAEVELPRAVARAGDAEASRRAVQVLGETALIGLDEEIRARAATLPPPSLRSLDAIHLASAIAAGSALDGFVTYDARLAEAARAAGLEVLSPS